MIIVQCELSDAHNAIYRTLNQVVATKLRLGAYVFDMRGPNTLQPAYHYPANQRSAASEFIN